MTDRGSHLVLENEKAMLRILKEQVARTENERGIIAKGREDKSLTMEQSSSDFEEIGERSLSRDSHELCHHDQSDNDEYDKVSNKKGAIKDSESITDDELKKIRKTRKALEHRLLIASAIPHHEGNKNVNLARTFRINKRIAFIVAFLSIFMTSAVFYLRFLHVSRPRAISLNVSDVNAIDVIDVSDIDDTKYNMDTTEEDMIVNDTDAISFFTFDVRNESLVSVMRFDYDRFLGLDRPVQEDYDDNGRDSSLRVVDETAGDTYALELYYFKDEERRPVSRMLFLSSLYERLRKMLHAEYVRQMQRLLS